MKRKPIGIPIWLLCLGLLHHCISPNGASAVEAPQDIVEAVKSSPIVQAEVSRVRQNIHAKESIENIEVVGIGGLCGVAGCSARYLAIITVHRGGANPQTGSVLATVERPARGRLGKVKVVELKTKEAVETDIKVQRKYSSPLPVLTPNRPEPRE